MAANKFATMVHRNTNRLTLVLVYAFLEWTLIALLLCNSLFSYLILKFADHFGLKRPCVLCSRLDRRDSIGDSICEAHAREVSTLEYCSSHQRLAESRDMCDDCSEEECCWSSKRFGFFPWTNRIGIVNGVVEEEEEKAKLCSCCGVSLSNKRFYQPCIVIKPSSWGVLDYAQKEGLVENNHLDDDHDHDDQSQSQTDHSDRSRSDSVSDPLIEENGETEQRQVRTEAFEVEESEVLEEVEEKSETGVGHLDFYIGEEDCTLIPIDIDRKGTIGNEKEEEEEEDVILDFEMDVQTQEAENWHSSGETMALKPLLVSQGTQTVLEHSNIDNEETRLDDDDDDDGVVLFHQQGCDSDDENDGEISIGTSIPDHEQLETSVPCEQHEEDHFSSSINLQFHDNHVLDFDQEIVSSVQHYNHSTEDGSEMSESFFEGEATAEKLKSALRAVYAELEEERSASAVAASHTMAMINRLQEEKATVQMEAVQYRRLMEEQSEYDQEALRLLNDLLVRRERENSELKKDLDEYRLNDHDHDHYDHHVHDHDHDGDYHDHEHDDYENTPVEAVLYFEEERLSILDQLRVLEEKLFALSDEDIVDLNQNQNHHFEGARMLGVKGRRLLPLFDAEAEDCGGGGGDDDVASRVAAEEEVDRAYERLQVLEADREFVRRCVGSLKKGDKGLRLLGEILDNLRRLRTDEHL